MTPEAQRIAIAESVGWRFEKAKNGVMSFPPNKDGWVEFHYHVPDYLNDLNAMHEVEKQLMTERLHLRKTYRSLLIDVCADSPETFDIYWMSNAAQRAEAYLKTLSLWKP